jgi:adenylate kinase
MYFILGAPCAGKGTISNFLKNKFNLKHISAGTLLRQKYPIGTEVRAILDSGGLVDINLINNIMEEEILKNNFNVLMDGFPRAVEQAQFISSFCEKYSRKISGIFLLKTYTENLVERMINRTYCAQCDSTYKEEGVMCCNTKVGRRTDDNIKAFYKRLDVFERDIENLLTILNGPVFYIDANKSIENVEEVVSRFVL